MTDKFQILNICLELLQKDRTVCCTVIDLHQSLTEVKEPESVVDEESNFTEAGQEIVNWINLDWNSS
jgi:hypothetical protein